MQNILECSKKGLPLKYFLLLFFIPVALFSSPNFETAVVKISSSWASSPKKYFGSGLLFRKLDKVYCLTSDHILFHTNDQATHFLQRSNREALKARYLISDWGKGLALLEVVGVLDSQVPTFEDLGPGTALEGEPITVMGYPYLSESNISFTGGKIQKPVSDQAIFSELPGLIRVTDSYGEFGMSGGPAFNVKNQFLGVLSHQDLTSPGEPQKNLLLIPSTQAVSWIEAYFKDPNGAPIHFIETPYQQGGDFSSVASGRLAISVGRYMGNASYQAHYSLQKKSATPQPYPSANGYYEKIVSVLQLNPESPLYVYGFRQKGDLFGPAIKYFDKLVPLTRLLEDSNLEPITWLWTVHWPEGQETLTNVVEPIRLAWDGVPFKCGDGEMRLCNLLRSVGDLVRDQVSTRLKPSDLEEVIKHSEWPAFEKHFGSQKTQTIKSLLERLRKIQLLVTV